MLPPQLAISPLDRPPDATVVVPGSKSHTNRALVCAALAAGTSRLDGVLVADDTEAMCGVLADLGLELALDREAPSVVVTGVAGSLPPGPAHVDARQSGTTGRFVLPMLACGEGTYVLDGHEQLRARPFDTLVDALEAVGVTVEGRSLPLTVQATGALPGGTVRLAGSVSSQFLSGLLLSAPCATGGMRIELTDEPVSTPYIDLTLSTMRTFGATVEAAGHRSFAVAPGGYRAADVRIEPDASAASYFFAAAAITGGRVRVEGLGRDTVQGDLGFVDVLARMGAEVEVGGDHTEVRGTGALRGVEVDMADISDTAQTLAAVATFASTPTRVTGIGFIRRKETDRIGAVVSELRRLGITAIEEVDGFVVEPGAPRPGTVATYDDHRMAMSFALLGLVHPGIVIDAPGCVAKTFPDYFDRLDDLRATSTKRSVT
ncbi:MAG: 3-phosphoshikimate 1-carboxyvinyltransferase [Actinomycetota bacterium]